MGVHFPHYTSKLNIVYYYQYFCKSHLHIILISWFTCNFLLFSNSLSTYDHDTIRVYGKYQNSIRAIPNFSPCAGYFFRAYESSHPPPAMRDKYYAKLSRHAGLVNICTMPTLPHHAGIFSNFFPPCGYYHKLFPPCEIVLLNKYNCQDWLVFNHQIQK